MDEKDKKIQELEKQLADMGVQIKSIQEANTKLVEDNKKKDEVIEQKTKDLVGIRKENTRLKDLTDEEREKMSEKEIELHNTAKALQEQQEQLAKDQQEWKQKEITARVDKAVKGLVGSDQVLIDKVKGNYGRIKDAEKAESEDEIARLASEAFNMLGVEKPASVSDAMGHDGGSAPGQGSGNNFANSDAGKGLAQNMGLAVEPPAGGEQK